MRVLLFAPFLAALLLSGCGTTTAYEPTRFPLRSGRIASFEISGGVIVSSTQTSPEAATVYSYGSTTLTASLRDITAVLVQQANEEVVKDGRKTLGDSVKTIGVRVDSLESENHTSFYKSKMLFQATLGNGQVVNLSAAHASANLVRDLDGCIADGVVALLLDDRIRSYLQGSPALPPPAPLLPVPQDDPESLPRQLDSQDAPPGAESDDDAAPDAAMDGTSQAEPSTAPASQSRSRSAAQPGEPPAVPQIEMQPGAAPPAQDGVPQVPVAQ